MEEKTQMEEDNDDGKRFYLQKFVEIIEKKSKLKNIQFQKIMLLLKIQFH